jgi:leucyl aminopeptidase
MTSANNVSAKNTASAKATASSKKSTTAKTKATAKTARTTSIHFAAKVIDPIKQATQCLVIACFEGAKLSASAQTINVADALQLETLIKREQFQGKAGQTLLLLNTQGIAAERLLILGMGKLHNGTISATDYRAALAKISESLKPCHCTELTLALGEIEVEGHDLVWQARQIAENLSQLDYRADKLKSKPSTLSLALKKVTLSAAKADLAAFNKA